MLWPALDDPDPVLIFEHVALYNLEGELPTDAGAVDIDRARGAPAGRDVTLDHLRRRARQGARGGGRARRATASRPR